MLNEAVSLRPVGGPAIMRRQLEHVAALAAEPHITIQVLPFSTGGHPAMNRPYVLLRFPDAIDDPVVYLDNITLGLVLEEPEHVDGYTLIHERLCKAALSREQSVKRLEQAARDLT